MAELTAQGWLDEISKAQEYLDGPDTVSTRINTWDQHQRWYDNDYGEGIISVNLVFAIGRALVPQLYFKTPTIVNKPTREGQDQQAKILESVDEWLVDHIGLKYQLKLGIIDAFATNLAVYKFGYHSVGTELPTVRETPETPDKVMESLEDFLGPQVVEQVAEEDKNLKRYSHHDWIKPDTPWMLRTAPEDFLVPQGCKNIYEAPWCAFRIVRNIEEIRLDPVYSGTSDLQPNFTTTERRSALILSPNGKPYKKQGDDLVEMFEIWDKRTGRIHVVADGHQKWLRNDEHNLNIDGLPVEVLQFNPVGWDFWGPSDVIQIHQQVLEYNETRTLEIKHKRSAVTKVIADKDKVSKSEARKMADGTEAVIFSDGPPASAVHVLNHSMNRDLFAMSDVIRDDVREILGFSRNQAGDFDVSRRTATEAAIVQQAIQLRSDERRDQIGDLIAASFQRKIHPMIFEYWTEPRTIEVTGLGGWQRYTGPQIKGNYNVRVVADSTLPLTKAQRRQTATELFTLFKDDPRIKQQRLYEWLLRQFEGEIPTDLLASEEEVQKQLFMLALKQSVQAGQGLAGLLQQGPTGGNNGQARPSVQPVQN